MAKKDKEKQPEKEAVEEVVEEVVEETLGEAEDTTEAETEEIPTLTPEEIVAMQELLETSQREAAENLDGWQRAKAEFINYKKRMEREQIRLYEDASARVTRQILDALDDLDRALANRPQDGEGAEWAAGIELIQRKLHTVLANEGVTPMETDGQMFDPNLHEAIAQEESPDHESGQIIEVLKKGYLIGERVLRPATVRVAS